MIAAHLSWDRTLHIWHVSLVGFALFLSVLASGHAILYKRDSRAALGWVGFVWLVPLVGAVAYFVFGVNRLRHKAASLRANLERFRAMVPLAECTPQELGRQLPPQYEHLHQLAQIVGVVVDRALLPGNQVDPLINGDEAYPAMLEAIAQARTSISFVNYIFDRDEAGLSFARALGEATRRGVAVRVLIDATGALYSRPTILRALRHERVPYATFLPSFAPWHLMSMNMRTHRKILVVDGQIGFTGGMNIRIGHCLKRHPTHPVQDIHFRINGPVVTQLQETFAEDWLFTEGESLRGPAWFPHPERAGQVPARGVPDGPDENFEKLLWTLLGALAIARSSVRIVTPYFLPEPSLVSALNLAAMRGVQVDIILPAKSNLPFVQWASRANWWQVLKHGCRIWLSPPPFDHSKLMLVDGCWVLLGSANWDPRSFRLNFEFNLECYDVDLATRVDALVEVKRKASHLVTLEEIDRRSIPARLRDGTARLLSPYL
jgi:cardiolipin synthase